MKPMNPLIGGHEGVGEIVAIGEGGGASPVKVGDRVGIKWLADSCLDCEFCRRGFEMSKYEFDQWWFRLGAAISSPVPCLGRGHRCYIS